MIHHHKCNVLKKYLSSIKSEKGDGISIVILGTCLMLMFIFTSVNILNGKIIEEKYNTLKDSVQSAAAGSVIHLLMDKTGATGVQQTTATDYDPYLQLALGYLVNTNTNTTNNIVYSGETNNFIKLDHKKVVTSTLELISKTVLGIEVDMLLNNDDYEIIMFFIEPTYDGDSYEKTFDLISYRSSSIGNLNDIEGEIVPVSESSTNTMAELYNNLQTAINNKVNEGATGITFDINLGAGNNGADLVREMQTNPYYLVVVKDFALPTLFGDTNDNIVKSAFTTISGSGKLKTPICALQAGKIERKEST